MVPTHVVAASPNRSPAQLEFLTSVFVVQTIVLERILVSMVLVLLRG